MAGEVMDDASATIRENLGHTREALSVQRVFGEAYELDGVTLIPVARVSGGAGGGAGRGTDDDQEGSGFGSGFRLRAEPVGVYEIHDTGVEWRPTLDIDRVVKRSQVLAAIVVVCVALVLGRRRT